MMNRLQKLSLTCVASLVLYAQSIGAVVVADQGTTVPTGFATGLVNATAPNSAPFNQRFGWDAGEIYGQTFTLDSAIVLDSIFIAYNGFDDPGATGTFTITVDAGNDGGDDITESITLASADFSGNSSTDGNSGPAYWMQWDLSSNALALGAGLHSFEISLDSTTNAASWLLAPIHASSNLYSGGSMFGEGGSGDRGFAITAVPEPSTYALIAGFAVLACVWVRRRRRL